MVMNLSGAKEKLKSPKSGAEHILTPNTKLLIKKIIWTLLFKNLVLDVLFPKYCLGCGREGAYICKDCELFMLDLSEAWPLTSMWEYNGIVKRAIKQAKYKGEYEILKELVGAIHELPVKNAIITYVPMHIKDKKRRGFNQAEIIAKELGKKYNLPVVKLLEKIRQTLEQAKLTREERLKNLVGAIHESPESKIIIHARAIRELPLSNILLVDDVYTTGATMAECARILHKAGFKNIWPLTLAKTI